MTAPDRHRVGAFAGLLILSGTLILGIGRAIDLPLAAFGTAYMFTPLLAGLLVCLGFGISLGDVGMRVGRPRWLTASVVVGVALIVVTLAVALAMPGVWFDPPGASVRLMGSTGLLVAIGFTVALGVTVNAIAALGEEFGWRGYLLWELAPLGFWRASAAVGAFWGLWHAPVIVLGLHPRFTSFPVIGIVVMTVACMALSPVYTALVIRAKSVVGAAVLHGTFNSSAGFVLVYASAESPVLDELVASPLGVAGIVAAGLVGIAIALGGAPVLDRGFARDGFTDPGRETLAGD